MSRPLFSSAPDRCTQYAPTLLALFDGQTLDLALLELTDARAHLDTCALCHKQWRDWELTRDALRSTTTPPPADLRLRVNLAVRLRAPFESVPTPPPGLRDAILRATVGVKNAVMSRDLSETFDLELDEAEWDELKTFEPEDAPLSGPMMTFAATASAHGDIARAAANRSRQKLRKFKAASAWLTPVFAAWLIVVSTHGQWSATNAEIALPTLHPSSLRTAARAVKARASHVLSRLHLDGATRAVAAPPPILSPKATDTTTPNAAHDDAPDASHAAEAVRAINDEADQQDTPSRSLPAHQDSPLRRDRADSDHADRPARDDDNQGDANDGPRFQLAGWHPTRPVVAAERHGDVSETPVRPTSQRMTKAPALSTVSERMDGAPSGTRLAMLEREDGSHAGSGRGGTPLASRGGRRANLSASARSVMARFNGTRFAPTHVANPQLVSRVSWDSDAPDGDADSDADAPLRLADHRPVEVSKVVDDFRAALDDEDNS